MNLEKFILSHMLLSEDYGRKALPFVKDEYFASRVEKTIFKLISEYVNKYNTFPTKEAMFIDLSNLTTLSEQDFKAAKEYINDMSVDPTTQTSWLLDQTEKFCQDKAIYNAIYESISILENKKAELTRGAIPKILSDALAVSFDTNIGHDYLTGLPERYAYYNQVDKKIPFDLEFFNKITNNGVSRKTLNVFMASTGVGKTMLMCHMAADNLVKGFNVLYITLEMSDKEIAKRIDANLLDIPINELRDTPKEIFQNKLNQLKKKTAGTLIVKEYPTASANVGHFRQLLNELRLKKNFVPDIVYIDYINICASSRLKLGSAVNTYSYIKSIAEEVRGLAVEFDVPIISATQSNRGGYKNSDVDLSNTSESFGLPQTVDFMVALIVNDEVAELNQVLVKQLKNRYNDVNYNASFVIGVDRTRMRFYDVDMSEQENLIDGPVMDNTEFGLEMKKDSKFSFDDFK